MSEREEGRGDTYKGEVPEHHGADELVIDGLKVQGVLHQHYDSLIFH